MRKMTVQSIRAEYVAAMKKAIGLATIYLDMELTTRDLVDAILHSLNPINSRNQPSDFVAMWDAIWRARKLRELSRIARTQGTDAAILYKLSQP